MCASASGTYPSGVTYADLNMLSKSDFSVFVTLCDLLTDDEIFTGLSQTDRAFRIGISKIARFTGMSESEILIDAKIRKAASKDATPQLTAHVVSSSRSTVKLRCNALMLRDEQAVISRLAAKQGWLDRLANLILPTLDTANCYITDSPRCLGFHTRLASKYRTGMEDAERELTYENQQIKRIKTDISQPLGAYIHPEWFEDATK